MNSYPFHAQHSGADFRQHLFSLIAGHDETTGLHNRRTILTHLRARDYALAPASAFGVLAVATLALGIAS